MMHRILRQTLDISAPTETVATSAQNALSLAFRGQAADTLSDTLDRLAGPGVVRVRRLEIDLGELSGPDWMSEFITRMQREITRNFVPSGETSTGGAKGSGHSNTEPERDIEVLAPATLTTESLWQFLQTGRLPWWSQLAVRPGWMVSAFAGLSVTAARELTARAIARSHTAVRLVEALNSRKLAEFLTPAATPETKAALIAFDQVLIRRVDLHQRRAARRAFWQAAGQSTESATTGQGTTAPADQAVAVWRAALSELSEPDAERLTRAAISVLDRRNGTWATDLKHKIGLTFPNVRRRDAGTPTRPDLASAAPDSPNKTRQSEAPGKVQAEGQKNNQTGTAKSADAQRSKDTAFAEDAAISVTDAGLVILHPFLPELFRRVGLWADDAFVDDAAPHLAARLLAHAALGYPDAEDAEMQTALTMIGLPEDEPLLPDLPDNKAIQDVDALLGAVLDHWSALRSSSADWLRSQFLLRPGLIRRADTGPVLTVESLAQDVLLTRLPWGIGTITLPWMKETLHVRWLD